MGNTKCLLGVIISAHNLIFNKELVLLYRLESGLVRDGHADKRTGGHVQSV